MIAKLAPYEHSRESDMPWPEHVPPHWRTLRLKVLAEEVNDQVSPASASGQYIALEHVESWTGRIRPSQNLDFDSQVKAFKPNDVLFGKLRPYLAKVTRPNFEGVCVGEFLVLRARTSMCPEYLETILRSKPVIDVINASTFGAKMPRANWGFIGNLRLPVPPPEEQDAIVRYLDYMDRRIRRYIAAKQRLIKLLEEQKQAIVQQAVTRGLDPNVRLKPSGVEWLGDIPEHWEVRKLGALGTFLKGRGISRDDIVETGKRAITYGDIYTQYDIEVSQLTKFVTASVAARAQSIQRGDLLFAASGETIEEIGKTILYDGNETAFAGGDIIILRPSMGESRFLSIALNSRIGLYQKSTFGRGDIIVHISATRLKQVVLALPPRSEQIEIATHIHGILSENRAAIEKERKSIVLLREYRTRLIADVVTGKLDVRGVELPDDRYDEDIADVEIEDAELDEIIGEAIEEEGAVAD